MDIIIDPLGDIHRAYRCPICGGLDTSLFYLNLHRIHHEEIAAELAASKCSVQGCTNLSIHGAKEKCSMHYARERRLRRANHAHAA